MFVQTAPASPNCAGGPYCSTLPCTSSLVSNSTAIGFTFQIRAAYSPIERSDENIPERAVLRIDMRVQRSVSR